MANTQASLETFFDQINSGKLNNDKQIIYRSISKIPGITLIDLKRRLKMSHQTISARVSDLLDMGVVEIIGKQTRIGSVAISQDSLLKVQLSYDKIMENRKKRSTAKFIRSVKGLLSFEHHLSDSLKEELNSLIK